MFAGEKKEKHHDNDKEQEESMTSEMISEVETNSRGTQVSFRRPIHNVCEKKIQTSMHRGGQSSQEHSTHLNFKKPPISVDNSAESKHPQNPTLMMWATRMVQDDDDGDAGGGDDDDDDEEAKAIKR